MGASPHSIARCLFHSAAKADRLTVLAPKPTHAQAATAMSTDEGKLSFTIRRPSPVSRASSAGGNDSDFKIPAIPARLTSSANSSAPGSPLRNESPKPRSRTYGERDSSDEEEETEDELVTGFDKFGVQRCVSFAIYPRKSSVPQLTKAGLFVRLHEKKKPQGPLVIPALKNKDWRELARKRKNLYVPPSAAAQTGADGSVGGLGTRDTINSGPQLSGLQTRKKIKVEDEAMEVEEEVTVAVTAEETVKQEETEDQKAIRALIDSAQGGDLDGPRVDIIPAPSEDDAYRQDVEELPDLPTLDDYERVPVAQFGAALLRGMGWKEGTAASRKGQGPVEPWLPQARPALLGIGAKEKEVFDDGSKGKKKNFVDKRYIPVIKQERRDDGDRGSRSGSGSGTSSRRRTPSPRRGSRRSPSPGRRKDRDRRRDKERDRDSGRERERDSDRTKDKFDDRYEDREKRRDRDYRDKEYDSRRDNERDRERSDRSRRERDRR